MNSGLLRYDVVSFPIFQTNTGPSTARKTVVSCAVPVGTYRGCCSRRAGSLNFRLRRGVGQAAHTRIDPHVKCTEVYFAWIVNNAATNEMYGVLLSWLRVPSLPLIVQLHSTLPVTVRDNLHTATGGQGSYSCTRPHTFLARLTFSATSYKQKEMEGNYIPPMLGLLGLDFQNIIFTC